MKGYLKREDDFSTRRKHLHNLTDEELKNRFWELAEKLVDPMLDLAKTHTTPSIERSVLLRMGFSSIEAKPLVDGAIDRGLMGKGVGHLVYKISEEKNISIRQAGEEMIEGNHWDTLIEIFKGGKK
ncbi:MULTISPECIES: ornithine aminomutase subunit alpha [Psychrilyobacter]|uniref:Ornithine aminomutase n=1 Tax=Psychrilyobacter piezotolerans TaxID=2293438 RepID=A0ABX9KKT7_9FUSO|nr:MULTISPECIES: ornithine aminomutase subunit alpha [Psychrilyobacter]MCS5420383.1 ornithine aminomutase subunit alpha [Psychrilyobacter sp. S5]NDI76387.1 ornithine aminomutase [Psychrilyobacter piezotolerans]RDE65983.1 ornithine aminomutase [Psychrilyobacter sp. S5]REI43161.1 ornithine aminomutase [Psychrilyobacter piezotolerans]